MKNNTNVNPVGDRILVQEKQSAEKVGLLYIPQDAREKPQEAKIVAIGDECKFKKLAVGQTVIVSKYCGTEIKVDGQMFRIVNSEDIMATIG